MQTDRRSFLAAGGLAMIGLDRVAVAAATHAVPAQAAQGAFPRPSGFARLSVGEIQGLVLSDGSYRFPHFQPLFAPEAAPDELNAVMREGFADPGHVPSEVNTLLLRVGGLNVLIDAGFGRHEGVPGGRLLQSLSDAGLRPEDIDAVLVTHAHRDHLWGLATPDGRPTFPRARVLMSRREHAFWTEGAPDLAPLRVPEEWKTLWRVRTPMVIAAVKAQLELVAPGDRPLGDQIELLDTAGHTAGHMSVLVDGGNESLLVAGDLVHNQAFSLARPRWTTGFDWDLRRCVEARLRMLDRAASERLRVLAYHLPWPGLGYVARDGAERYRWCPDRWAW